MALKPVSVSQLNSYIKRILQTDPILGNVSVMGEVSNLKFHSSGHVYFSLKDANSRINCFLPSDQRRYLRFELADGMQVTASGFVYLYERGGTYSLNVREISVNGRGNLSIAFEELKKRLDQEGLFDAKYKKELPVFPKKVAVITSPTGAAVRDIIKIIKSRNDYADVLIFPCLVQGPGAAPDISRCIQTVNRLYPEVDVMIVGRGGGSMEELWAFNEEIVARSIFLSEIPVISAVGHETDFTIADFVADLRAETPTAAAQAAVPDLRKLREYSRQLLADLSRAQGQKLQYYAMRLSKNSAEQMLALLLRKAKLSEMRTNQALENLRYRMDGKIRDAEHRLAQAQLRLEGLNPYGPLERGYGMVFRRPGEPLSSVEKVREGDRLRVALSDGALDCVVDKVFPGLLPGEVEGGTAHGES